MLFRSALDKDAEDWVAVISNVVQDGKAIGGLGSYELVWHTDMSYNPRPPRASLLYALEVPADGGDTGFLNMYAAYQTLPDDLKRAIDGKPAGIGMREDERRITHNDSRFVPHYFEAGGSP